MQSGPVNLLLIGGCAEETTHLPTEKYFVQQLIRRFARNRRPVRVDYYPSVMLPAAVALLTQLSLHQYELILLRPESPAGRLPGWFGLRGRLTKALTVLKPYRHRVVVMTPFPQGGLIRNGYRRLLSARWQRLVRRAGYSVFDTQACLKPRDEYFLDTAKTRLNAVSHELLAQELFDYCQAIPTVLATEPIDPPAEH